MENGYMKILKMVKVEYPLKQEIKDDETVKK